MRKRLLLSAMTLLMSISSVFATDTYNCPYKDGLQGTKVVDGELLFYDYGGPDGNAKGYEKGYTIFKPSNEGDDLSIEITSPIVFNGTDTHLYIYEGDCGLAGWSSEIPAGWVYDLKNGDTLPTYTSTTGTLSVLYSSKSESGAGWEARITAAPSTPMAWKALNATQDLSGYCYPSLKDVTIIRADLQTEGGLEPFPVSKISFNLDGTTSLSDIKNLRCLYSGASESISNAVQYGAVYDSAVNTLEFSEDKALKSGHNYFWLVADVDGDATPGDVIDASLTSAVVSGIERVDAAISPEGSRTVANMLFMQSGTASYNVGEKTINFYDDGGPEAAYSANFSGTATFLPTVEGKKVKIDFTKFDLFTTSSVGYNDVIKVYSGNGTDDANLLASISTNTPATYYSVSEDGALTVSFTSSTGYPKGGFEAEVSLFTPEAMEVSEITSEAASTATISAGASNEALMLIDLKTVNTEPAATVNNFKFNYSGTEGILSKATLYYIGTTQTTAIGTKVGEGTIENGVVTITAAEGVALAQGDNYFRLAVDMDGMAQSSQTVAMTFASVDVNGSTRETVSQASVSRTVQNICYAEGTQSVTIYGDWTFANKPSEYSYYGYDALSGDQIVTFLPGVEGEVVQMQFSKLSIAWPYYGTDPSLKIYSGTPADGELLYSVTKDTKDVVPTTMFRSKAASGALSIVFNANGTKGSYTSNGFAAAVSLYKSHPMEVKSVEAVQASTANITPASFNNEILSVKVTTDGDTDPCKLNALSVNLKGSAPYVKNVKLISTGASSTFAAADDSIIATAAVENASQESVTFTFSEENEILLSEGDNYFWIAYDMADTLTSDVAIDASILSATVNGAATTLTNADPEGSRLTKNLYYFQNGDNVVTVDDSLIFYDNAGPDAKYTTDAKGTVTFMPTEGKIIKFNFRSFYTNVNDDFYVYNGASTASADQLAKLYSSKTDVDPIISTADNGALTVAFNPTKSGTNDGWEIEVVAFVPEPLAVASVTSSADVCPATMLRGSINNNVLKTAVEFSGERGNLNISNLNFDKLTTETAAVKNAKLWYTTTDAFSDVNQYGETVTDLSGDDFISFSDELTVRQGGTYYFWLTYDIAEDAPMSSVLSAKLNSVTISGECHNAAADAQASATIGSGMHGTYTIGASDAANYHTFVAAVEAMKSGIDGEVVFEVESGEYVEKILLPEIPGSSDSNRIIIRSKSGNAEDVKVSNENCDTSYGAEMDGVLKFRGVNYATVENISFTTSNTSFEAVVLSLNKSRHNTLSGCRVTAPTTTSYSEDVNLVKTYNTAADSNNDYFTVRNCYLEGGYIGVSINGASAVSPVRLKGETGTKIVGNTLVNQGSKAMFLNSCVDVLVDSNVIENDGKSLGSSVYVVDAYRCEGNPVISNNKMRLTSGSSTSMYGIYLRDFTNDNAGESYKRIYNNDIQITGVSDSKETSGIKVWQNRKGRQTMDIVNNTIVIKGSASSVSAPLFINDSFDGCKALNNILCSETGYAVYVKKAEYLTETSVFANNAGSFAGDYYGYVEADCDFAAFETAVNETGGISEKPQFVSEDDHELKNAGNMVAGKPVDYVTTDILGRIRTEIPTIGAYEYQDISGVPTMMEGYPKVDEVAFSTAKLTIGTLLPAVAQYKVCAASEAAPGVDDFAEVEDIISTGSLSPVSVDISGLKANTAYKAYVLLTSYSGEVSEVYASEEFTTDYLPTAVSTFENVTAEDNGFDDGTASFVGFEVVEDSTSPVAGSAKVAAIPDGEAVVTLTNAANLTLDGFFLKNTDSVLLTAYDENYAEVATKTLPAGEWRYVNLRDMGALTSLGLSTDGDAWIDDFSGKPLDLVVGITDMPIGVLEGTATRIIGYISGGVGDYTITWSNAAGETLGNALTLDTSFAHSTKVRLSVVDAWGNSGSDAADLVVTGTQHIATFEDLGLAPDSHWMGEEDGGSSFFSGSFEFANYYYAQYSSWGLFGYSSSKSSKFESYYNDQYNSAAGGGAQGSDTFGVGYISSWYGDTAVTLSNAPGGQTVPGLWLTNNAWTYDAVINGDGMSDVPGGFAKGDYYKVTITGEKADKTSTALDVYLADYRAENAADRYALDTWEWVDLSSLGKVTKLIFTVDGTKSNSYGLTTPSYICVDNIGSERPVEDRDAVSLSGVKGETATFSLVPMFDFDPEAATVVYDIECDDEYATLGENGVVNVPLEEKRTFDIIAHASSKGRNQYVRIPVSTDATTGVEVTTIEGLRVYPVPAHEVINIATEMEGYDVALFNMGGAQVVNVENCSGFTTVNIDGVTPGAYILRITSDNGVYTKKIVVK